MSAAGVFAIFAEPVHLPLFEKRSSSALQRSKKLRCRVVFRNRFSPYEAEDNNKWRRLWIRAQPDFVSRLTTVSTSAARRGNLSKQPTSSTRITIDETALRNHAPLANPQECGRESLRGSMPSIHAVKGRLQIGRASCRERG